MDRSGNECQVIPQKVDKDTTWKDEVYNSCVKVVNTGVMPAFEVYLCKHSLSDPNTLGL